MSYAEYKAQLLAVEAKLAKDPENEELLELKGNLIEFLELYEGLEEEKEEEPKEELTRKPSKSSGATNVETKSNRASSSKPNDTQQREESDSLVDKNNKRALSEAEILLKKKEKNRKKKAKLRERHKEQLDIAESEKQSWQSFANKKGLKGVTKKSIFASPCSVTGKVGVGTNGIADAPSAAATTVAAVTKRRY